MLRFCLFFIGLILGATLLRAQSDFKQRLDDLRMKHAVVRRADSLRLHVDSLIDLKNSKANIDTNYILKPRNKWTLKTRVNVSGTDVRARTHFEDNKIEADLKSLRKVTLSLAAAYKGLSFGIALNPAHLVGKNNDYELNLNAYGNRFGGDVIFHSAKRFTGTLTKGGMKYEVPGELINQNLLDIDAYYAFNFRRFSYPAAFSQSFIQRRSSGSWMLELSFIGGNYRIKADEDLGTPLSKITMGHVGVGGGYGYNLVTPHRWLFHLSGLPSLVVYSGYRLLQDGNRVHVSYHFPEMIFVGRAAVIHEVSHYFFGVTAVLNTCYIGDDNKLEILNNKWRCRAVFGVRL
jgi:hypothetical protein